MDGSGDVVILLSNGEAERAGLSWSWSGPDAVIEIDSPSLGVVRRSGHDLSAALAGVRAVVEPVGARILCNGARRDATASGMLSQSTGASRVYLLDGVPHGQRPVTGGIFEPAAPDMVGTLAEQEDYRRRYFEA
jgi:hypothetical protein